jgi:hypothetical protein
LKRSSRRASQGKFGAMSESKTFPTGRVVFDDRYAPLLIATFFGEMGLDSAEWFERTHTRALHRQIALGSKVVSISDATRSERPSPEVRRFWAENTQNSPPAVKAAMLGTFVVIDSAILRGAMTAIGWLSEEARAIEPFRTVDDAIAEAVRRLDGAGFSVSVPRSYSLPPLHG